MPKTAIIDTNILVYLYDVAEDKRRVRSEQVLANLHRLSVGYLSVKTLSEFFIAVRRLHTSPLTTADALNELQKYASSWPVLDLTPAIVIEAARGVRDYQFSYWDAQIWATAKIHHLNAIFTEDMNTGSVIEGVAIVNPLLDNFDFEAWFQTTPT